MGCNCGKSAVSGFTVKRPGLPDRTVTSESAAQDLVKGISGATYTAVGR